MELIRATSPELFNIGDTLIDISAKGEVFQYTVTEILPDYIVGTDIEENTRLFYNELFPVFLIFKITDLRKQYLERLAELNQQAMDCHVRIEQLMAGRVAGTAWKGYAKEYCREREKLDKIEDEKQWIKQLLDDSLT